MFSGGKFCCGKMAVVFLLQQFNHIFHVIGQVLKEGWREGKSLKDKGVMHALQCDACK